MFRFTFLEIYPWSSKDVTNTPLEFVWKPATHKLDFWFYGDENTESLYKQVLPFFQHIEDLVGVESLNIKPK